MDQDRDSQLSGGIPERREEGVIGEDPPTPSCHLQAEVLPDLQPPSAGPDRSLECLHKEIGSVVVLQQPPVHVTEREEAIRIGAVISVQVLLELAPPIDRPGSLRS